MNFLSIPTDQVFLVPVTIFFLWSVFLCLYCQKSSLLFFSQSECFRVNDMLYPCFSFFQARVLVLFVFSQPSSLCKGMSSLASNTDTTFSDLLLFFLSVAVSSLATSTFLPSPRGKRVSFYREKGAWQYAASMQNAWACWFIWCDWSEWFTNTHMVVRTKLVSAHGNKFACAVIFCTG